MTRQLFKKYRLAARINQKLKRLTKLRVASVKKLIQLGPAV